MSSVFVVTVIVIWLAIGLITSLWMIRRGHSKRWMLIAVPLGPLFVSAAVERVEHVPRMAVTGTDQAGQSQSATPNGLRVLVGMDGSPESERAFTTALKSLGPNCGLLMLAEVVSYDESENGTHAALSAATQRLAAAAARARAEGVPVQVEILAGPPGETLRHFAVKQQMDLLAVGRRGRGLSARLLGSVSAHVVGHSSVPVLVVEPNPVEATSVVDDAMSVR